MQGHNMASWRDFEGVDGFGQATQEDLNNLRKALNAGAAINAPASAAGEGFPLRVESLERTLKNTTYRMQHVRLWKGIPKQGARNTVEEFNRIHDYGALGQGAFVPEGALPGESDSTYERAYAVVKFMGTTRVVSHPMTLVQPAHGNVIAQETVAGTMYLLRQLEKALFSGDSTLTPEQFDGYDKQITDNAGADHIIDLRGQPLTEDSLNDAALTIQDAPAYGMGTHLHLNPKTHADLTKTFFPKARYDIGALTSGKIGGSLSSWISPAGEVSFEPNVFIDDGGAAPITASGPSGQIPQGTFALGLTVNNNANGTWSASEISVPVHYTVTAVNRFGRTAAVTSATATPTAADDDISIAVTLGGGGVVGQNTGSTVGETSYYEIYRGPSAFVVGTANANMRLIARVPAAASAAVSHTDTNADLPGTTKAFLFQQDMSNMAFKQLAPMIKVPLATITAQIRWMQLIYGVPVLYTPRHNVLFKNIGRAPDFVGSP